MCMCECVRVSWVISVFKSGGAAEMERLETWLLPVGTWSLFNKRVWRPEGHVREMLLPGSYE